ncbi:MAG: GspH/FimT family pseudopilin [Candidatus Thiodiazotropha sp.]
MKQSKGFTVIELMIAIVIGAILVTMAVPLFNTLSERSAVATTSNDLLSGLLLARSEAVRQEINATFTPGANSWQVDAGGNTLLNRTVDDERVTIAGDPVTYNARGRASLADTDALEISFEGTLKSRVCLSLTGRPFIRSADDGDCP